MKADKLDKESSTRRINETFTYNVKWNAWREDHWMTQNEWDDNMDFKEMKYEINWLRTESSGGLLLTG